MSQEKIPSFSTFEEIIQYAMNEEQEAHDFYVKASEQVFDPDLKTFLQKLADMEVEHYETLRKKLEEYRSNRFCMNGIISSFGEDLS